MNAYIGQKVIILEKAEHEYVHVVVIDGDEYSIDENGFLGIKEGFKLGEWDAELGTFDRIPNLFHPAGWAFVYDNKNPGLEPAAYRGDDERLPTIYPNCSGVKADSSPAYA